ncbi:CD109 antigen [Aedes aegypti]|uniref:TEP1-F n=1 Tax=Aedes aegypti TaxID=7159 RepID=A0A6I8T2W0_AEDAE|nr:CD109 antigen [Aedes aegypti]
MIMNSVIVLVCSFIVVAKCQSSSVLVIGPKYIRPRHPFNVAFANSLNSNVNLKLTLQCDGDNGFVKNASLRLNYQSAKSFSVDVPNITSGTDCTFSAVNDGGSVMVDHMANLLLPAKTLSVFIITDKPVYKPGDILRFRVVVVDIATKPVKHMESIVIEIIDSDGAFKREWLQARLLNGVFEAAYRLPSVPALGIWNITATANDNGFENTKVQDFEVREYVIPKVVLKVVPSRTLLIAEKEISLDVKAHYTFGEPVEGKLRVDLFTNPLFRRATHSVEKSFNTNVQIKFKLDRELALRDANFCMVSANVSLTEKLSNVTTVVTLEFPVFRHPYKIELINPAMNYRPGVGYTCKLSVKDHFGIPVDAQGNSITVQSDTDSVTGQLDRQGMVTLTLPMPDSEETVLISVVYENVEYNKIIEVEASEDLSTQYLHISTKTRIIVGNSITFTVNSNQHFTHMSYFVTNWGGILLAGHQKFSRKKTNTIRFKLTAAMSPYSRLLVYTISGGQLIMDYFELDFEFFGNEFEFMLDDANYRPDQDIYVDVKAEKNSYLAFQAIDQGALLLGFDEFGLTRKQVQEDLASYVDADEENRLDLIHSFGLFLRSGFNETKTQSSRAKRFAPERRDRPYRNAIRLRTDFSESWFWKNSTMKNQKTQTFHDVVPDSITSWYVTGFALSPTLGLGLMHAPRKFTVTKPFYMVANLPYSIKRGEVVRIQIMLFNFLNSDLTTDVTLFNKNDEIDFVDRLSNNPHFRTKAIIAPHNQVKSVSFLIKAKKLGEIAIKIEAVNQLESDGLEHMLRVTPESRLYEKTEARFIDLPTRNKTNFPITCNIPRDADPGSTKIEVFIDPPLMGFLAQNTTDSLLKIPTGASNLNLLTFVPNIVLLEYLKETGKVTPSIEQARNYVSSGYKNQLKYKHSNGAFGQWNPPRGNPSVFLTALVANALATASKHIDIDKKIVEQAYSWISGKQKPNGCFEDDGEVIYTPLQNNSSSFALTAFIVSAIMENENIARQFAAVVQKATNCLAGNFDSLNNLHDIALTTYALALVRHEKRQIYLDRLIRDSIFEKGSSTERYWNEELNVEIAAYALLSYLQIGNVIDTMPIMTWLNKQRYSTGVFSGVQRTFVALKALGKMATYLNTSKNDYSVYISYDKHKSKFDVLSTKSLETFHHELPDSVRNVNFAVEGIGFGYLQLTYQYHRNIQNAKASFMLDVTVLDSSNYNVQDLRVCLSYKPKEKYTVSGVALVEVYLPSGLIVKESAVRDISRQIQRTERAFDNTAMFVYFNGLDTNSVCFDITAHRKFKIAMHRPSYVVVYDTNDMSGFAIKSYEGKVLQICDICDDEDCRSMSC